MCVGTQRMTVSLDYLATTNTHARLTICHFFIVQQFSVCSTKTLNGRFSFVNAHATLTFTMHPKID